MNGDVELRATQSQAEVEYEVDLRGDEDPGVIADNSAWVDDDTNANAVKDEDVMDDEIEGWD